ncbi:Synapse-associated protein 1 [Modicella reniformis]|uniref:Synapse-associated protein 1 n=1 Tax=Modicella reniformis TaxID=1440133 RepID=A0A9P6JHI1_9FUNG|nr:Synapse-associated protein 1 [Modicella reniformis]
MSDTAETTTTSRPASESAAAVLKDTLDHPSSTDNTVDNTVDKAPTSTAENVNQEQKSQEQQQPQTFAAAVFPGFNPPKINTSAFFSSMQGKLQSTLANAKSPTINKVDIKQIQAGTEQLANSTKDWGVSAFRSLSNAAQRVSANVTQGIQKEHEEFIRKKKLDTVNPHQGTESLPPWTGLPDEEKLKARILSLSKDKRNFLLPPPPGTDFVFDMIAYSSTATATLTQDPNLDKMRFYLVPREVEELVFWRNYFYRVSLLKQLALATASSAPDDALSGLTGESSGSINSASGKSLPLSESSVLGYNIYFGEDNLEGSPKSPRRSVTNSTTAKDLEVHSSTSPTTTTAAAAAKQATSKPETKKQVEKSEVLFEADMPAQDEDPDEWLEQQLASKVSMDGNDGADIDVGDWEKELQNELKDYVEES